ncbi:MAG TPA: divergent polysaccharide deacetylase family protein [Thermoanaerobaculia bacterium]|nr:divergent polysaccharide deacetylase family protein [Thermoanaerobaculia bacterium]
MIIIDDVGYEGQPIDRAMAIDPNFNFAVLPNSTRASQVAERLHGQGFEILCHLPMEPRDNRVSPGSNAVLTSMSDTEIVATTRENIAAVPHASGVNNHMGSLATSDRRVMTDVMRALPRGMYFIDSRTDGASIAARIAHEMNVKTATRQVFLDDVQSDAAVRHQVDLLSAAARAHGIAIGIGHPHDVTLRVLAQAVPQLKAQGFAFVRASQAVN